MKKFQSILLLLLTFGSVNSIAEPKLSFSDSGPSCGWRRDANLAIGYSIGATGEFTCPWGSTVFQGPEMSVSVYDWTNGRIRHLSHHDCEVESEDGRYSGHFFCSAEDLTFAEPFEEISVQVNMLCFGPDEGITEFGTGSYRFPRCPELVYAE